MNLLPEMSVSLKVKSYPASTVLLFHAFTLLHSKTFNLYLNPLEVRIFCVKVQYTTNKNFCWSTSVSNFLPSSWLKFHHPAAEWKDRKARCECSGFPPEKALQRLSLTHCALLREVGVRACLTSSVSLALVEHQLPLKCSGGANLARRSASKLLNPPSLPPSSSSRGHGKYGVGRVCRKGPMIS